MFGGVSLVEDGAAYYWGNIDLYSGPVPFWQLYRAPVDRPDAGHPPSAGDLLVSLDHEIDSIAVDDTHLFWTDVTASEIGWIDKTGGTASRYADALGKPSAIVVDEKGVYWTTEDQIVWQPRPHAP